MRFSPDGQWLTIVGGDRARPVKREILERYQNANWRFVPITFDTLAYMGSSWSADSRALITPRLVARITRYRLEQKLRRRSKCLPNGIAQ